MKVKALITLVASGKEVLPGSIIEIADGEAQGLINREFAAEYKTERTSSSKVPKPSVEKKPEPAPEPALEDILDALAELDKIQDFSKGGKPTIQELETLLKASITAVQLDRAFEIFLLGKEEGPYDE